LQIEQIHNYTKTLLCYIGGCPEWKHGRCTIIRNTIGNGIAALHGKENSLLKQTNKQNQTIKHNHETKEFWLDFSLLLQTERTKFYFYVFHLVFLLKKIILTQFFSNFFEKKNRNRLIYLVKAAFVHVFSLYLHDL
jgi:hypothetical protein